MEGRSVTEGEGRTAGMSGGANRDVRRNCSASPRMECAVMAVRGGV